MSTGADARTADGPASEADTRLPARALGWLFVAGATIGLVSLLLPHSPTADDAGLYSNVALAYLGGLLLLRFASQFPAWVMHAALVTGVLLITRAILLSGEPVSFYAGWYIWVGLYSFFFFSRSCRGGPRLARGAPLRDHPRRRARGLAGGEMAHHGHHARGRRCLHRHPRAPGARARPRWRPRAPPAWSAWRRWPTSSPGSPRAGRASRALPGGRRVSGADRAILWEPTEDGIGLQVSAASGGEPTQPEVAFAGPPAGAPQAFITGAAIDGRTAAVTTLAREFHEDDTPPAACLWQPIKSDGVPIAVLGFYWDDTRALDEPSVRTLTHLFATEAAVTLERVALLSRLETIARTDELTGLPNRRAWQEHLPREVMRSMRSGEPLCVAMLDLDHFKRYNDRFGHQAGDRVLKQVAGAWSSELRPMDILARYGGEEFALALPGADVEEALAVLDRLRARTPEKQRFSAGVARWDGVESARELVGRADGALYDAKRAGRDRTIVAPDAEAESSESSPSQDASLTTEAPGRACAPAGSAGACRCRAGRRRRRPTSRPPPGRRRESRPQSSGAV